MSIFLKQRKRINALVDDPEKALRQFKEMLANNKNSSTEIVDQDENSEKLSLNLYEKVESSGRDQDSNNYNHNGKQRPQKNHATHAVSISGLPPNVGFSKIKDFFRKQGSHIGFVNDASYDGRTTAKFFTADAARDAVSKVNGEVNTPA